jgi:hypothetical protein
VFEELYDPEQDPTEVSNVIDEPSYSNIARQLRNKLIDTDIDNYLQEL